MPTTLKISTALLRAAAVASDLVDVRSPETCSPRGIDRGDQQVTVDESMRGDMSSQTLSLGVAFANPRRLSSALSSVVVVSI